MKTYNSTPRSANPAFTLVEMIGVLAIIATLAGVLLPRVFRAITDSQVNSVAQTVSSLKTAISTFYSDNNAFPANDGALLTAGLIEKPLSSPIGTGTYALTTATNDDLDVTADGIDGSNFDIGGDGTTTQEVPLGASLATIQLANVNKSDAEAINAIIDGDTLDDASDSQGADGADEFGQVIYNGTAGAGGFPTTVYIYVAHR